RGRARLTAAVGERGRWFVVARFSGREASTPAEAGYYKPKPSLAECGLRLSDQPLPCYILHSESPQTAHGQGKDASPMQTTAFRRPLLFNREHWFRVALLLFFVLLGVKYSGKIVDQPRDTRSAFLRWREQILMVDEGINVWEHCNYPNPPIMAA